MGLSPVQHHPRASDLPLERLAGNSQLSEAEKVREVGRQFEAVLLRQILSAAQKPVFASSANPDSASTGIYQDMLSNQLADAISRSSSVGLGDSLARQLQRQLKVGNGGTA